MHQEWMREKYSQPCGFRFDLVLSSCLIQDHSRRILSLFLAASVLNIEIVCHGTERPRSEEREGRDRTPEWGQKGHFAETCRYFCPGEFSFPLWPQINMSQGALRCPAWLGRGVKKSDLSKMIAWGVLRTKAQAKPCAGITPSSLKTQNQESQNPSNLWVGLYMFFRAGVFHATVSEATSVL